MPKNILNIFSLHRLVSSAGIGLLSSALGIASGLLLQPLLLRTLGDVGYLRWTAIIAMSSIFSGSLNSLSTASAIESTKDGVEKQLCMARGIQSAAGLTLLAMIGVVLLERIGILNVLQIDNQIDIAALIPIFAFAVKFQFDQRMAYVNVYRSIVEPRAYELVGKLCAVVAIAVISIGVIREVDMAVLVYFGISVAAAAAFSRVVAAPYQMDRRLLMKPKWDRLARRLNLAAVGAIPLLLSQSLPLALVSNGLDHRYALVVVFSLKVYSIVGIVTTVVLPIYIGIVGQSGAESRTTEQFQSYMVFMNAAIVALLWIILISIGNTLFSIWLSRHDLDITFWSATIAALFVMASSLRTIIFYIDLSGGFTTARAIAWLTDVVSWGLIVWMSGGFRDPAIVLGGSCASFLLAHGLRSIKMFSRGIPHIDARRRGMAGPEA